MSDSIAKKLKKYVLYISIIFFVTSGSHLIYSYLYDGSTSEAIEGGTVSEAIIGAFPHFNPLIPSNDHNSYINGLLYRSMLQYSPSSNNLETDLVNCNLDNLLSIECTLQPNLVWSNGNKITSYDIKATLDIIRETRVNPIIASLLEDTTIEVTDDSISFRNGTKDINFLQVFLQPIIPEEVVNTLDLENIDGKFSQIWWIYSGRFILQNISQDETVWITKVTLWKNEDYFWNDIFIQFLIINLFQDEAHLLKNRNSFNIYNDKENIIGNTIPRLNSFEYSLSQFVWSFLNTESISQELRKYILSNISRESVLQTIGDNRVSAAYNPFLSDYNIDSKVSNDFSLNTYFEWKWYYSKTELLKSALALRTQQQQQISAETLTRILQEQEALKQQQEEASKITQEDLQYLKTPNNKKYSFVSEDNILIEWRVPEWVDSVFINDYKLTGFTAWDDVFYYRLLEEFDSISEWENSYEIYYETGKEKQLMEEFFYIYYTDEEKLSEVEANFFTTDIESSEETVEWEESTTWENNEEITVDDTGIISDIITSLNPEQIQQLDERFYYTPDGEAFTLKLLYSQSDPLITSSANDISLQLNSKGINVDLVGVSLWDITSGIRNDSLEYDIVLLGINLGYFKSNMYPYLHSSQVVNGYNFANFKKLGLDILLEELKSNNLSATKREELEVKILEILEEENIIKVLYTPKAYLLVDKNIKNYTFPDFLPDTRHRYLPLLESYLTEKKIINKDDKGVVWFFGYLIRIFNS